MSLTRDIECLCCCLVVHAGLLYINRYTISLAALACCVRYAACLSERDILWPISALVFHLVYHWVAAVRKVLTKLSSAFNARRRSELKWFKTITFLNRIKLYNNLSTESFFFPKQTLSHSQLLHGTCRSVWSSVKELRGYCTCIHSCLSTLVL